MTWLRRYLRLGSVLLCLGGQLAWGQMLWQAHRLPVGLEPQVLLTDQQGFLWVGGRGGLYRFDGRDWQWQDLPGDSLQNLSALVQGGGETLWAGSEAGGLWRYDGWEWESVPLKNKLLNARISALVPIDEEQLWVATYGAGLGWVQRSGEVIQTIGPEQGLPSEDIYTATLGSDGTLWLATDNGLVHGRRLGDTIDVQRIGPEEGLPDEIVTALDWHAEGALWLGFYRGSYAAYDPGKQRWLEHGAELGAPLKQVLIGENQVWLLTERGQLFTVQEGQIRLQSTPQPLAYIHYHEQGLLWGIGEAGSLWVAPTYLGHLPMPDSLAGQVQALAHDPQGGIWLGLDQGILRYDLSQGTWRTWPSLKELNASALVWGENGGLWIGTMGQGLWHFQPEGERLQRVLFAGTETRTPILSLVQEQGDLWLGTFSGAFRWEQAGDNAPEEAQFEALSEPGIDYVYQVGRGPDEDIWLGTDGPGLCQWSGDRLQAHPEWEVSAVLSFDHDPAGGIWLLTPDGLLGYAHGGAFDTLLSLPEPTALGVLALDKRRALILHEAGIWLFDRTDGRLLPLLEPNLLPAMSLGLNAHLKWPDGSIGLALERGLLRVQADRLPQEWPPQPHLREVLVNLLPHPIDSPLELTHDQNHLTFGFAGLGVLMPEQIDYRYRLRGHDLDWITTHDQQAIYAGLPPGKYVFELRIGVAGQYVEKPQLRLPLRIRRAFWQTLWFWLLMVGLLGLALYGYVRQRERRIRKAQDLKRENMEYQFQTLRSQINPHFLFNTLATLSGLIEESPQHAVRYVDRLSDLFRQILTYRERPLIALQEELALLDNYYQLQRERYGEALSLTQAIDHGQLASKVPPLVLQLLVENAIKHNKLTRQRPLQLTLRSEAGPTLVVANNLQPRAEAAHSTQVGLQNIRDRYRLLTEREVEVGEEAGQFVVRLPLIS